MDRTEPGQRGKCVSEDPAELCRRMYGQRKMHCGRERGKKKPSALQRGLFIVMGETDGCTSKARDRFEEWLRRKQDHSVKKRCLEVRLLPGGRWSSRRRRLLWPRLERTTKRCCKQKIVDTESSQKNLFFLLTDKCMSVITHIEQRGQKKQTA